MDEDDRIYQDDRISLLRDYNTQLRKSLSCISHQQYDMARECFEEAVSAGSRAISDNNQFYIKELFTTYHKYYAAFKKIKYLDGAKWSLLEVVGCLRKMKIPREKKTKLLADLISKYVDLGGDKDEIKQKWQQSRPLSDEEQTEDS